MKSHLIYREVSTQVQILAEIQCSCPGSLYGSPDTLRYFFLKHSVSILNPVQ